MSQVGFAGNQDLYGVGIRVGYYTTALSLWISHEWAPSESHFLHPITITFLIAMIVGVSVLSRVPADTYAIEPFMLMQISYYTYFMGLGGPLRPDHLPWERDYPKYFLTHFVGLLLYGYDTWYWFAGIWHMRRTPGVDTTGLMIYFGRVTIFDWISYVMRVFVVFALLFEVLGITTALYQQWWEKRLDHQIPPERLKYLANRWARVWEQDNGFAAALDSRKSLRKALSPPMLRHLSSSSVRSAPVNRWLGETDDLDSMKEKLKKELSWRESLPGDSSDDCLTSGRPTIATSTSSEPEAKITRAMTDHFKKTLLGWQPDHEVVDGQPIYKYTPTLEGLSTSLDMLRTINKHKCRRCEILMYHHRFFIRFCRLFYTMSTHEVRPKVLFAIRTHIKQLNFGRREFIHNMLRLAITHPAFPKVQPEDILLASRILLTLEKPRKPSGWPYFAVLWTSVMTCSLLVIGTELAIQWNVISGVQNISSVGQLIPMAIGVCGLIKTLHTALVDKKHGETWCFGACRGSKKTQAWEEAVASFERARAAWKRATGQVEADIAASASNKDEKSNDKSDMDKEREKDLIV